MITNNHLLIVGGTGRDVGKTEFVCRLIEKISPQRPVYAIKVSSIFPGEELYHGTHFENESNLHLFEETKRESEKDTSRMLNAGAARVFYLRTDGPGILTGFTEFVKKIPANSAVVCESNSLGQYVRPALSIMVRSKDGTVKPRAITQLQRADLTVVSDGVSGFPELASISFSERDGWASVPDTMP